MSVRSCFVRIAPGSLKQTNTKAFIEESYRSQAFEAGLFRKNSNLWICVVGWSVKDKSPMSEAWLGKLKRKNMDTAMMQPKTDALIIS